MGSAAEHPLAPVVAAHRQVLTAVGESLLEDIPGGDAAQRETADGPVVTGCEDAFLIGLLQIGGVMHLNSRNQVIHIFLGEDGRLAGALAPILGLVVLVPGGRNGDEGSCEAVLDHVVKEVHQRSLAVPVPAQEILLCYARPAMKEIDDVIFLRCIISIGQINVCRFAGRGFGTGRVVLGIVPKDFHRSLLRGRTEVFGRHDVGVVDAERFCHGICVFRCPVVAGHDG